ncbi:MAG: selenocysteine lyase/cysteine desulfurase [Verrucomicrobiales bacterium]|jgi:selenocysteine lyase/cysteine desulfurase
MTSDGATLVLTADEIEAQRAITPGTAHVTHLNHAGSSLPPQSVLDTQVRHLELEATIGGYEAAASAAEAEGAVYASIASLLGAKPTEIARAEHASIAWCQGFWSLPMEQGQRILTVEAEYGANAVSYLRAKERYGIEIEVIPSDASGQVDLDALDSALGQDVALVAITHVPTNGGLINPAAEVGALTRKAGVPFLLDACQSAGQMALDVHELGCDMLSVTGRKYLRGPRGSGFLYVSEEILPRLNTDHPDHFSALWVEPDRYELQPDARRFEYWEFNHAAWLGLGTAVDHALAVGVDRIEATVQRRAEELREALREHGFEPRDLGERRSGIVTTTCDRVDPFAVKKALGAKRINISVAGPEATLWDSVRRDLPPLLRLSVHYLTTREEIDSAIDALVAVRASA